MAGHSIRLRSEAGRFYVIVAETEQARLTIREERDGRERLLCSLELRDRGELLALSDGLRRALGVPVRPGADQRPERTGPADPGVDAEDPDAIARRARQRTGHAFEPWSARTDQQLREMLAAGEPLERIAAALGRSERAVEVHARRLGLLV